MAMVFGRAFLAVVGLVLLFGFVMLQGGQETLEQVREAVLAPDAGPENILALGRHPELFEDRNVQRSLFRALRSSDQGLLKAVFELCFRNDSLLTASPIVRRRFDNSFLGSDPTRKRLLLEVAERSPDLLEDLRVVSLLSEA